MPDPRGVARALGRAVARFPFETCVLLLATVYVACRLSPSSYALALEQLGGPASPALGDPRPIRSDEWSILTPLFQVAVNNDFQETNQTSFYGETLRSFIGLPLLNWALIFKPLVLPFMVVPPAFAYSFFWAANAALMLIGWSLLLRALGFRRAMAGLASAIIYFSPFVQAWTSPWPYLALFPWVLLAIVRIKSPVRLAVVLTVLAPVWWLSLFYPPAYPPLLFLGIVLCAAFRPEVFAVRKVAGTLAGLVAGGAITVAYFAPVFDAYRHSVYPGDRWVRGGGLPEWQVISQFLPGTTTEHYTNLVNTNICEAATVATWLPLLVACTIDFAAVRARFGEDARIRRDLRSLAVLAAAWILLTAWQVVPLPPLSYVLGLGLSPEARTLFASGALLVVASAYALDRLPVKLTVGRLGAFAALVVVAWLAASSALQPTNALVFRDELYVLFPVVALVPIALVHRARGSDASRVAIFMAALIPTVVAWGLFNPVQRTTVMFRKPVTELTRDLDALAASRSDHAIAVEGVAGAVLNGVGYRSVAHVITVPEPGLFRPYFPDLDERTFNEIFNRYAQVSLTRRARPEAPGQDAVWLPIRRMSRYAAVRSPE